MAHYTKSPEKTGDFSLDAVAKEGTDSFRF